MAAVDDVYESWEDMDDIGLDRKFTNFLPAAAEQCPKKSQIMSNGSVKVLIDMNGSIGAQLMVQQPAVKILKRPVGINGSNSNGECKARPVKTLQQRQQEYEQARLRILGEARSPEDVAEENITNLQIKMEASCIQPVNRIKEKNPIEILSPKVSLTNGHSPAANSPSTHSSNASSTNSSWTNASPLNTGSPSISSPAHTFQPRVLSPQPVNLVSLLRTPRGPDGTRGFTLIR